MIRRIALSLVLVVAGFIGGLVVTGRMRSASESLASAPGASAPQAQASAQNASARASEAPKALAASAVAVDFTRVAAQAVKGVANISSLQVVRGTNSPLSNDPFFRYFFGDEDIFGSRDRRSMSLGSGVIISSDGYIVTNNHVIGGENGARVARTEITIALPDKREVRGRIIGTDPATDIALVKANLTGLAVVPWGDSTQLKVGEWVLAIGSPFSLSQTVTAGIVSAVGRTNVGFADYEDFIQTDAAINPGNSGGALVNTRGELVGINTGIFSQSGGYQGIGFAVPSNLARRVVDDLMKYGEVRRGSIGSLSIEKLTPEWAQELGAPSTKGALISRMTRASEAYDAGLRPGDIIVGFNGQAIDDPSQFSRMVSDARIGTTAAVKVLRNGRAMEFRLPIVSSSSASRTRQ
ncbi:MAG TPA: trypsin-like peptidase domain-containing protein [Vicinamibacterales bacterium]|nr:trypsin-like peptidase domain-containing protein [Vicinamibacterales bacterium]